MNILFQEQEDNQTSILQVLGGLIGMVLFILLFPLIMFLRWVHGPEEPNHDFGDPCDQELSNKRKND